MGYKINVYNLFLKLGFLNKRILALIFINATFEYDVYFSYISKSSLILKSFKLILNIILFLNNQSQISITQLKYNLTFINFSQDL